MERLARASLSLEARGFTEAQACLEVRASAKVSIGGVTVCLRGGSAEGSGW